MPEVASEKCQGETSILGPLQFRSYNLQLGSGKKVFPQAGGGQSIRSPSPTVQASVLTSKLGGSLGKFLCPRGTCTCAPVLVELTTF